MVTILLSPTTPFRPSVTRWPEPFPSGESSIFITCRGSLHSSFHVRSTCNRGRAHSLSLLRFTSRLPSQSRALTLRRAGATRRTSDDLSQSGSSRGRSRTPGRGRGPRGAVSTVPRVDPPLGYCLRPPHPNDGRNTAEAYRTQAECDELARADGQRSRRRVSLRGFTFTVYESVPTPSFQPLPQGGPSISGSCWCGAETPGRSSVSGYESKE